MGVPRVVLVHRRSEYEELLARHGTRGQADFFLRTRERSLEEVHGTHETLQAALRESTAAVPLEWRRAEVERADLPVFAWEPRDIVVVVGPDGLVANTAKYLTGQPVIGVDPLPGHNPGVLVPHRPAAVAGLLGALAHGDHRTLHRTMVAARTDDGQELLALNEIFLGAPSHQSARYRVRTPQGSERQCSSGVIVGTGTGATGWCASLQRLQAPGLRLPRADEPSLAWFVREPWPSPSTGADLVAGTLEAGQELEVDIESDTLVVFGDGMEADRLTLSWGQRVRVGRSARTLRTVI